MSLGKNLKSVRESARLSQEELAAKAEVSLTQISKIERDATDPRCSTLVNLSRALNCSLNQLVIGDDKTSLDSELERVMQRTLTLRPREKAELINVIHKYCTASLVRWEVAKENGQERQDWVFNEVLQEEEEMAMDQLVEEEENSSS